MQTILFAWAFGALLEGLVGFGYPRAFVATIPIAIGIPDLDAIRVAAIANNPPVFYDALGRMGPPRGGPISFAPRCK